MIDPKVSDPVGTVGVLGIALAFFAGACLLFVALGPSLATLHAFAGFIVLAIVAAANQLIPFLTGVSPAHPRVVLRSAAPLALGFVALIAGITESCLTDESDDPCRDILISRFAPGTS